jgi:uncharacterized membrane protein YesL
MRVASVLTALGDALILQLTFLILSIPLVTAAPAAVALQRQLSALREGEITGVLPLLREFRRAWHQSWPLGVLVTSTAAGFTVAIPFWFSTGEWFGLAGVAFLVALLGLASAYYLNLLHAADVHRQEDWRSWMTTAFVHLAGHPLRSAWAMLQLITWLALLISLPALAVIGTGLVPALIVRTTLDFRRPTTSPAA